MGLKDLIPGRGSDDDAKRPALAGAGDPRPEPGTVDRLLDLLVDVGIDGRGPLDPVREVADRALATPSAPPRRSPGAPP